jgi:hypothetical protein
MAVNKHLPSNQKPWSGRTSLTDRTPEQTKSTNVFVVQVVKKLSVKRRARRGGGAVISSLKKLTVRICKES